jgi:hypothetical protein
VATTAAYYADKKERPTVGIGDWLTVDENVVPMPSTKSDETIPKTYKKESKP